MTFIEINLYPLPPSFEFIEAECRSAITQTIQNPNKPTQNIYASPLDGVNKIRTNSSRQPSNIRIDYFIVKIYAGQGLVQAYGHKDKPIFESSFTYEIHKHYAEEDFV